MRKSTVVWQVCWIILLHCSFQELREVRVAFQLYESEDMLGLLIDERLLMRTLKVMVHAYSI